MHLIFKLSKKLYMAGSILLVLISSFLESIKIKLLLFKYFISFKENKIFGYSLKQLSSNFLYK